MQNSASTMIAMFIAGILLFIVPLVTLTDRNDNVTQENVKLIVEEFVTEIRNTGELTRTKYQDFSNKLYSMGSNTYEIEIEIKYLDENPGKKTMQANYTKIGENVYYSEYTTQILKKIGIKVDEENVTEEDNTIKLKEGDIVYVAVRNEDSTTAQTLKSSFLSFSNAGEYVISASSSAMVTVNGESKITEEITPDDMLNYEYKITYNANGGTGALGFQGKSYGVDINITSVKPTREGYNFLGWSTNPTSQEVTYIPGDVFSINANITLYAVWEIKTFSVMYNANGGIGAPASQIKTWGIDLRLSIQSLTRTGYTFLGWSEDSTKQENPEYLPGDMYTKNATTTLFAVWKPHKYTIAYDANGGINAPEAQIKTHDIILTLTSVEPTRTGYTFLGWSINKSSTVAQYLPGAIFTIEANTVLYAIWKIDTYKITYNANGGTGAPGQQIKTYGIDLELSLIEPTKTGYTFLGWNTDASATTSIYKAGGTFKINAETTLYAIWEINKYTVKYDPNRGIGEPANQTKTYGIDLILSSTQPKREGYTFLGWSTSSTATSPTYISGATYTDNADIILYAVWRINTYTISYNANGGIGAPAEQIKTYGIDLTLSTTKPTREGYTFLGWDTNKTATTVKYTAGGNYTNNEHVTLYAVWDLNKYTISYNENSGSGAPAAQVKTHGVDLTLSKTKPTKTGYTFLGWSTNKNAQTASYIAGGTFTINADTILYAIWQINTYTITYDANQGSGAPSSQTKTYGIDLILATTKPTRTGYTFLGWSTTSTSTSASYQPGGNFTTNADTTLFAVWKINVYTISYDPTGGTGAPAAQTKTHNVRLVLSTTKPTRTGYTFLGWSTSSSATTATYTPGGTFTTNANTTLYAIWSVNTYTITYNANGGTGAPSTQPYIYDSSAVIYLSSTKPTRTGYTFLGWSQSSSASSASYSAGQAWSRANAAHYTLYAVWQANTYTISYNANGGSGAPSATKYTYASSGVTYLSSTEPTRTGYAFLGWSLSNNATSASYSAGQSWNLSNASNYTLYAVWQANTYTIKYDANGGSEAPGSQTKTHDVSISLSTTIPTKSGYIFLGWSTSASATSASYQSGATYTANGNVTLYAIWQIGTYTITYNRNGGTGTNISVSQNIGTAATIKPSGTFTAPSGRHFSHWNTNSSGTGTTYSAGASYTADKDVILYAIWAAHTSSCYNTKYHSHSGNSTSGGGCYTVEHKSGGSCGGGDAMWYCWYCGTDQGIGNRFGTSHSSDCIYQGASNQNGCHYHDSESNCSDWGGYTVTYSLGCGKTTSTIESQTLICGGTP